MKLFSVLLFLTITTLPLFAQQAQDYFPDEPGRTWYFHVEPLDSVNNPTPFSFFQKDSFAIVGNHMGMEANIVVSKTGPESTIFLQPYLDSSYYHFNGSDGFEYFRITGLDSLLNSISPGLGNLLTAFTGWYSIYRFNSPVNQTYNIFSYDTTVTIDGLDFDLRFEGEGKRLNDEPVLEFENSKKFLNSFIVSYLLTPIFPIELFTVNDTVWIAEDNWIVQQHTPSTPIDLSFLGLPAFYVPGVKRMLYPEPLSVNDKKIITGYSLNQNYPNPFNPATTIEFTLPQRESVKLEVFNLLGEKVAVLVESNLEKGEYTVNFNSAELSSGVYLYKLQTGSNILVKKMILQK